MKGYPICRAPMVFYEASKWLLYCQRLIYAHFLKSITHINFLVTGCDDALFIEEEIEVERRKVNCLRSKTKLGKLRF